MSTIRDYFRKRFQEETERSNHPNEAIELTDFDRQVINMTLLAPGTWSLSRRGMSHPKLGAFLQPNDRHLLQLESGEGTPHFRQLSERGQRELYARFQEMLSMPLEGTDDVPMDHTNERVLRFQDNSYYDVARAMANQAGQMAAAPLDSPWRLSQRLLHETDALRNSAGLDCNPTRP